MTKSDLKAYILRALGSPKIQIELDDTQLDDRINDAIELFIEYHYDGSDKKVLVIQTQPNQYEYTLPDTVLAVTHIFTDIIPVTENLLLQPLTFYNITDFEMNFNAVSYETFKQSMGLYNEVIKQIYRFDFNSTSKLLRLFEPPKGKQLAIMCYVTDISTTDNVYNNRWVKQYATALAGLQWANNISKYTNISLPGGAQINADVIEQKYQQMKQDLEQQLFENYTPTAQFFYG